MVARAFALLLIPLSVGQGVGPDRTDPRTAIMVAEDRRLALPPDLHTPAVDALRASLDEDLRLVVTLTRSSDSRVQEAAIRAAGRYENRELVPVLLDFLPLGPMTGVAATALAQAMRGEPLATDPRAEQVQAVQNALLEVGDQSLSAPPPRKFTGLEPIARALARLPYTTAEQVEAADAFLLRALRRVDREEEKARKGLAPGLVDAIESLARLHLKLARPGPPTIELLKEVAFDSVRYTVGAANSAVSALVAARGVDEDFVRSLLRRPATSAHQRRLAALALGGAGSPITGSERTTHLSTLLGDTALPVRIEATRAWARTQPAANGCWRLLDLLKDPDLPLVLFALDTLGDACKDDQSVTDRLIAEARTPPDYAWHREAHALVALAKRSPERAAVPILAFSKHVNWHVRMYAARAAALSGDLAALERLAGDEDPNVREAALPRLRALRGAQSDPFFVSALAMDDSQLLRTAATELKGAQPTPELITALVEALKRATADQKETSRDARLALLARIDELGSSDQTGALVPLLRDYDLQVALAAAGILQKWTGERQEIAPQLLPRPAPPQLTELAEIASKFVRVKLSSGKVLSMWLNVSETPLTSTRFYRLVRAGYFNGLTLHRIVPNFVIQGGSPGANEYAGDSQYGRDEISDRLRNDAGTVGLSTRGRDTGDAQFYFNLIDNPRLDYEYTVFGTVGNMADVERILEGDTIQSITFEKPDSKKK